VIDIAEVRVGSQAIKIDGQYRAFSSGRRCEDSFKPKVVSRLACLLDPELTDTWSVALLTSRAL
jgi:hypothetical protein